MYNISCITVRCITCIVRVYRKCNMFTYAFKCAGVYSISSGTYVCMTYTYMFDVSILYVYMFSISFSLSTQYSGLVIYMHSRCIYIYIHVYIYIYIQPLARFIAILAPHRNSKNQATPASPLREFNWLGAIDMMPTA